MKRSITKHSLSVTLTLVSDIVEESNNASSLFGPVKAALTTSQGTLGAQHTELLNYCLRSLEILQSKSYTGYATSRKDIQIVRALPSIIPTEQDGTDENRS